MIPPSASMRFRRLASVTIFLIGFIIFAAFLFLRFAPLPESLGNPPCPSVEFLDRHEIPLRLLLVDQSRYQQITVLDAISPHLIDATIAAEDARFFHHHGVDLLSIGRASWNALRGHGPLSGASTITQQLAKIVETGPRTPLRKIHEMWLALHIESQWSKNRILTEYLNRLDYGQLRVGIASASEHFFGKPASDLSPAESAFLAGLPKAPSRLNPANDLSSTIARQRWVLKRMQATGVIAAGEYERALREPLRLRTTGQIFSAPHFVDLLLHRRNIIPPRGGSIVTSLDLPLTDEIEKILAQHLATIADHNATSAATVVLHNPTGEVLALAASGNYFAEGDGQINGAWVPRSPGSALKPFTYLLALENGAFPGTVVPDVPTTFTTPTGDYSPNNYNHRFYGPVSLRNALGNSLNIAAIQTLQNSGGAPALLGLLRHLGITTLDHPADYYGLGLTLGNGEVRLLELANAYATLARGGIHIPYRLTTKNPASAPESGAIRLFSKESAFLLSDMLADNRARGAAFGFNSHLQWPFPVAVKTGTSSDYRDNWTIAYTPEFTVAVWVGNHNASPMREISGVTGAAPAMRDIFLHLQKKYGTTWFDRPAGIQETTIHPLTGHIVPENHPSAIREIYFHKPMPESARDYTPSGQVLLPAVYRDWYEGSQNGLVNLAVCEPATSAPRITYPAPGTIFYIDHDLPASSQKIPLRSDSKGALEWRSETLSIESDAGAAKTTLREGRHQITARSPDSNEPAMTWIEVREL